jgi:hypothetical protein
MTLEGCGAAVVGPAAGTDEAMALPATHNLDAAVLDVHLSPPMRPEHACSSQSIRPIQLASQGPGVLRQSS